jgi:hypothetical protein
MASLSFERGFNNGGCDRMIIITPDTTYNGYYCDPKLDRSTMPEGWYAYDFRTDDDGLGFFCTINHNYVMVNNGGTFFTQTEIPELREPDSYKTMKIDQEEWNTAHSEEDFDDEVDNPEDAWDYSYEDWDIVDEPVEEINEEPAMVQGVVFMTDEEANNYKAELDAKLKEM